MAQTTKRKADTAFEDVEKPPLAQKKQRQRKHDKQRKRALQQDHTSAATTALNETDLKIPPKNEVSRRQAKVESATIKSEGHQKSREKKNPLADDENSMEGESSRRKQTRLHHEQSKTNDQDKDQKQNGVSISKKRKKRSKHEQYDDARDEDDGNNHSEGFSGLDDDSLSPEQPTTLPLEARITRVRAEDVPEFQTESDSESLDFYEAEAAVREAAQSRPLEDRIGPRKASKGRVPRNELDNKWSLSSPTKGGAFINQDPILTADEQYIIIPMESQARVYSRSTSLQVRSLPISDMGNVVSCCLSQNNSARLLAATSSGKISLWDWKTGKKVRQWKTDSGLKNVSSILSANKNEELVTVVHQIKNKLMALDLISLRLETDDIRVIARLQYRPVLSRNFIVLESTGIVVITAGRRLIIGQCPGLATIKQASEITWREVTATSVIVSFDAKLSSPSSGATKTQLDIVVGLESGEIVVYRNLLSQLNAIAKKGNGNPLSAGTLHWHRDAVNSVKWSRDGNYLISGGAETVLVLWQLETNQKQYLPHLSAEILNISVSSNGASYALHLADNSVMVLSTGDLAPTSYVNSLALATRREQAPIVAAHPLDAEKLLLAGTKNIWRQDESKDRATTVLQTWDVNADMQISQQALTRNLTTTVNVSGGDGAIREPQVVYFKLACDGAWLATVEEWSSEIEETFLASEERHVEVILKFWSFDKATNEWQLVTRIDQPQGEGSIGLLSLESNPSRVEFVTAGTNSTVTFWSPRARRRDGVLVKNQNGEPLFTWAPFSSVSCGGITATTSSKSMANRAALAFSQDGSTLAAAFSSQLSGYQWTHLIDARTSTTKATIPDLASGPIAHMAFSGRYLLTLSEYLSIFDVVSSEMLHKKQIGLQESTSISSMHLAVNSVDYSFAIALNPKDEGATGGVYIYKVGSFSEGAIFKARITAQIEALVSSPASSSYLIIDGYRRIKHLSNRLSSTAITETAKENGIVSKGLDKIFGQPDAGAPIQQSATNLLTNGTNDLAGKTLEGVLRFQDSSSAPPVGALFDRVAGIFARAPVAVV